MAMHNPPHPGRILEDALEGLKMSRIQFAAHIGISRTTLSRIIKGDAAITPRISMCLSEAFGQASPDIWFKMQNDHDFWHASRAKRTPVKRLRWKD
jgi:antitoxin HigA-1